jgi:hypothetical protein
VIRHFLHSCTETMSVPTPVIDIGELPTVPSLQLTMHISMPACLQDAINLSDPVVYSTGLLWQHDPSHSKYGTCAMRNSERTQGKASAAPNKHHHRA